MATDHNFKVKNGLTVEAFTVHIDGDGTYGDSYSALGFGGTTNAYSKILAAPNSGSHLYINAGGNLYFRTNQSSDNKLVITASGHIQMGSTTIIDNSRNLTNIGTYSGSGTLTITKPQVTSNFATTPAIRVHPSSTTSSGGRSALFLGTSPIDNYGISLRGARLGTDGNPTFEVAVHQNSGNGLVALSIDTNRNASFSHNVQMGSGNATGKFAVKSSSVHASYDFYNNGTTYLNGTTEVNAEFKISSSSSYITHFNYQDNGTNIISQANGGSTSIRNNNGNLFTLSSTGSLSVVGNVIAGSSSSAAIVRAHYNDGSYMTLEGFGLVMNRSSSYIRPSTDGNKSLYIGGADASLDWASIRFRSTAGLYLNGTQFIDASRNLRNIGTINNHSIDSIGGFGFHHSSSTMTRAVGTGAQWIKVASFTSGTKFITLRVVSSGDNTTATDVFLISVASYGMPANILKLPSTKYNTPKLTEVRTKWVTGATYEIWIKVSAITTSVGYLTVSMNDSGVVSTLSAGTEPTVGSADTTLVVSDTDRNDYTIQASKTISAESGFAVGSNKVIDSNSNLTNIGTISSGTITSSGQVTGTSLQARNDSGYGTVEVGGSSGAFIDLKKPATDDYDIRIVSDAGTGGRVQSNGVFDIDAAGDITLDADGGDIHLKDNGVSMASFTTSAATFTGKTSIAASTSTSSSSSLKLHVGTINSTGSSAIAQFGGFIRAADYYILHASAGSTDALFIDYVGDDMDITDGEGSYSGKLRANGYKVDTTEVIDASRLVQNVDLKAGNSGARLKNDNWFYDTASNERIYFHSSNNYYKTASSSGRHVWRVGGDAQVMEVNSGGDLTIPGDFQSENATFTGTGDVTVKIIADTDNVTEGDTPTLGFSQDGNTTGTLFVLGLEGSPNTAFPGSIVNAPYLHGNVASTPLQIANTGKLVATFDSTSTNAALTITKFSNITGQNGSTILNLKNYMGSNSTTGDLSQQKSFIDFQLLDSNANEVPQVRIGAEVGEGASADSQELEGSGAFVVYTNDAESTSGDAGASLTEKFRVAHDGTSTFTNNVVIGGNLTVNGTQTTLNTATLQVEDKNIVLNYGSGDTSGSANGAGITIQDAVNSSTDATMLWNTSSNRFDFSNKINIQGDLEAYNVYAQDYHVLNNAGTGWHEWATRSDDRVNLSVHDVSANGTITVSSGAASKITFTNSSDSGYNVELRTAYDYDGFFRVVDGGGVVRFAVGKDNHAYLGGAGGSGNKVFHDGYHPNADKWTTPRSHTVTLTGEVTGTATQSVDGTGNKTWSIGTTLNHNSLNDQYVQVLPRHNADGDSLVVQSKASITIWDVSGASDDPSGASDGLVLSAGWDSSSWGIQQYHDFHTNDLYLRSKQNGTMSSWDKVFHDTYHPNADKWTTARSHTVTLTGEVTGTATQSVDGAGNKTWSIATTLNNTALDDQYVDVTGDTMTGNLTIGTTTDSTKLVFPDKNVLENPTAVGNKRQLIGMGNSGGGGMWQTTGRGGLMLASADDSLILASGDIGRGHDPDAGGWNPNPDDENIYLLTDSAIYLRTNLQTVSDYKQMSFDANGDLTVSRDIIAGGNVQHTGLTMTSGTDIDQLYTVTDSLTLTTSYQDTSINGGELSTGTYILQLYIAGDHSVGGSHYNEFYSGVISWYGGATNSTDVDEIVLHRAGHAPNASVIHLRTQRHASGGDNLVLQIKGNYTMTAARNYVFKFRRMI